MVDIQDWFSRYPAYIDSYSNMPELANFSDLTRVSQLLAVRDSMINLEIAVGSDLKETGSIRYNIDNLTLDHVYNNQTSVRVINVNDQPISFYGNQEIRFDGGPIRFTEQNTDPTNVDNYGFLYVKEIDGYSEFCYLDNYGNVVQLTNKGYNVDINAIHVNIASEISSLSHVSPAINDYLLIEDANDSNSKKSINISDIVPITTKGDIFTYSTTYDRFPVGSDGYLLAADSGESAGLKWIENVAGFDPNAVHKNIGGEIAAIASAIPVSTDYLLIEDADDSNNKKSINISDIVPPTTKGDIFTYSTTYDKFSIGLDGYILSVDVSEPTGLKWVENTTGFDPNAIHKNIGSEISSLVHVSPAPADYLLIEDADDSNNKKSINISDIVPPTTKGDIFTYSTTYEKISVGSDGYVLSVDTSELTGLKWIENVQYQLDYDGYLYLESQQSNPTSLEGYGIVYTKDVEGYGESLEASMSFVSKIGSFGTGNDQFYNPRGVTNDGTYLYICDSGNGRIVKRLMSNLSYVAKFGSVGSGDNQFNNPSGITNDGTYLYICDIGNNRIKKHLMSDLSYVAKLGSFGTGNDQFNIPDGITNDGSHLYICDAGNHRIKKHLMLDLSYVSEFGSYGTGNSQFDNPRGITNDEIYLYITDLGNNRIKKHIKSVFTYVSQIGSLGSGNDQFNTPSGITNDGAYLYICDAGNNRIKGHLMSDLSYIGEAGTYGSGNSQFDVPIDISSYGEYLYICDYSNNRICEWNYFVRQISFNLTFGTYGTGTDQFKGPISCINDGTYLYISDYNNDRVKKHLMSDLSYVSMYSSITSPYIVYDGSTYVFTAEIVGGDVYLIKRDIATFSFVSQFNLGSTSAVSVVGLEIDVSNLYVSIYNPFFGTNRVDRYGHSFSFVDTCSAAGSIAIDNMYLYSVGSGNSVERWLKSASPMTFVDSHSVGGTPSYLYVGNNSLYVTSTIIPVYGVIRRYSLPDFTYQEEFQAIGNIGVGRPNDNGEYLFVPVNGNNSGSAGSIEKWNLLTTELTRETIYITELFYLDNYSNNIQLTDRGTLFATTGHMEDYPPQNPSIYNDEWVSNEINSMWSWDTIGVGEPNEWTIKNRQLVAVSEHNVSRSGFFPENDANCLTQIAPSGQSWALMASLNSCITDELNTVGLIAYNTSTGLGYLIGHSMDSSNYPWVVWRYNSTGSSWPVENSANYKQPPKIIGIYYNYGTSQYYPFIAYDFSNDMSSWLLLDNPRSISAPNIFGIFFYAYDTYDLMGSCEWFRVVVNP